MSADELNKCYVHATDMLYNKDRKNPGKYQVRENILKTYSECCAELFRRTLIYEMDNSPFKDNKDVLDYVNAYKTSGTARTVSDIFENVPNRYKNVLISDLIDACIDRGGVINRKLVSDKFIVSQGVWFTNEEMNDLLEYNEDGKVRNRLDVIKERLFLKDDVYLRTNVNGLTYNELRSLLNIKPYAKISNLSTFTLQVLVDKILLLLDSNLNYHIDKWTTIKSNIEKVAELNGISLVKKAY